jgi:phosphoribosylamine--glycine ligase
MGHLGDIDVNCIVDEKGKAWPLEFTCRLGWPAANILWASHRSDPVEWMRDACRGKDTLDTSPQVHAGVVVAQPDYPYSKLTKKETDGIPIYGVTDRNRKFISPQAVKIVPMPAMKGEELVEQPTWTTAGDYLAVITGHGRTVHQACERAYSTIKDLHIPDMIYRDDIGEALEKKIATLHPLGYAMEFTY